MGEGVRLGAVVVGVVGVYPEVELKNKEKKVLSCLKSNNKELTVCFYFTKKTIFTLKMRRRKSQHLQREIYNY